MGADESRPAGYQNCLRHHASFQMVYMS
jgi:hypothetical protein